MTSGCRGTLYFEEIRLGLGLETGDFVQESRGGYRRTTLICFQQYAIHFPSSSKVPSPKSAAVFHSARRLDCAYSRRGTFIFALPDSESLARVALHLTDTKS